MLAFLLGVFTSHICSHLSLTRFLSWDSLKDNILKDAFPCPKDGLVCTVSVKNQIARLSSPLLSPSCFPFFFKYSSFLSCPISTAVWRVLDHSLCLNLSRTFSTWRILLKWIHHCTWLSMLEGTISQTMCPVLNTPCELHFLLPISHPSYLVVICLSTQFLGWKADVGKFSINSP